MRTASDGTHARGKPLKSFCALIEDRHHSLLDDLVFQCCDSQRTLRRVGGLFSSGSLEGCARYAPR